MAGDNAPDTGHSEHDHDPVALLVCQCLDRFEEEGEQALESICAAHPEYADRVRVRIESLRQLGLLVQPTEADRLPEKIESFRIVRTLGRGGMGIVFEAEQDRPRRRVALKLIRAGFPSGMALRRFAKEAELLGRLQHPGIAQIFEAGTTNVGGEALPYFAMELVDGTPIDQAMAERRADVSERLECMALLADAMDFAHERGVIHRDLKPDNVLVGKDGRPKVLDFGLARVADPDLSMSSIETQSGQMLGTLPYMSPEQARGDSNAVDRRSDVYSLGVLAHELLSHKLPYPVKDCSTLDAVRVICEVEPTRLGLLDATLRGDVETIVTKALEKDPARRYRTAGEFADDVRRFLSHEPIHARPPSSAYHLRKLVRRHRGLFGGIASALVLLILGTSVSTMAWLDASASSRAASEATVKERAARSATEKALKRETDALRKAEEARDRAQSQLAISNSVRSLLTQMLEAPDPWAADAGSGTPRDTRVIDVLDTLARTLAQERSLDPAVEREVRSVLGGTYVSLGAFEAALVQLERASELASGPAPAETLDLLHLEWSLAMAIAGTGDFSRAIPMLEQCVAEYRARPTELKALVVALSDLAVMSEDAGDVDRAVTLLEEARTRLEAQDDPDLASAKGLIHHNLGSIALEHGQYTAAEEHLSEALKRRHATLGEAHVQSLSTEDLLSKLETARGSWDGALQRQMSLLERTRNALGSTHPRAVRALSDLGVIQQMTGQIAAAESTFATVLERSTPEQPIPAYLSVRARAGRAHMLIFLGRLADAEPVAHAAWIEAVTQLGSDHDVTAYAASVQALVAWRQQRFEAARTAFEQSMASYEVSIGPDALQTIGAREGLALFLREQGEFDEAASLAVENADRLAASFPDGHGYGWRMRELAVACYESLEDDGEVELQLLEAYDESLLPDADPDATVEVLRALVQFYVTMRSEDEADDYRALLNEALEQARSDAARDGSP